ELSWWLRWTEPRTFLSLRPTGPYNLGHLQPEHPMPRTLILLAATIVACGPSSSPSLTDTQRESIVDSVKRHSEVWKLGAEHAKVDEVMAHYHNTPDAMFIRDQKLQTYDSLTVALRGDFATTRRQS